MLTRLASLLVTCPLALLPAPSRQEPGSPPRAERLSLRIRAHQQGVGFLPGFRFELQAQGPDGARLHLGEGRTGPGGTVELELPRPGWLASRGSRPFLYAICRQPGFQERTTYVLDGAPARTLELTLEAVPGGTLHGLAVAPPGETGRPPGETAWISCVQGRTQGFVQAFTVDEDGTWREADTWYGLDPGPFEIHLREGGRYALVGVFPSIGTGRLGPLSLDLDRLPEGLELPIRGPGKLAGRLLDQEGQPVPGMVHVLPADDDPPESLRSCSRPVRDSRFEEGTGFTLARTRTDLQGNFAFEGLQAGRFVLYAEPYAESSLALRLTPEAVSSTEARPLEFRLPLASLEVSVLDARGVPLPSRFGVLTPQQWPERWPTVSFVTREGAQPFRRGSWEAVEGKLVLTSLPPAEGHLVLVAPGHPVQFQALSVSPSSGRLACTFQLGEPPPPGRVMIAVRDPAGEPWPEPAKLRIVDPGTGLVLLERLQSPLGAEEAPQSLALPPGPYVVEVVPLDQGRRPDVYLGRTPFQLEPNGSTSVAVDLSVPARLEVEVTRGNGSVRIEPSPWEPWPNHAELWLKPMLGRAERVDFEHEGTSGWSVELGTRRRSLPRAPGPYLLITELRDGTRSERPLLLAPGETRFLAIEVTPDEGAESAPLGSGRR